MHTGSFDEAPDGRAMVREVVSHKAPVKVAHAQGPTSLGRIAGMYIVAVNGKKCQGYAATLDALWVERPLRVSGPLLFPINSY